MMGCREIEKSELLWFHLSKVKHQTYNIFMLLKPGDLHFLIITLEKKCRRTFFHRNGEQKSLTQNQKS